MKIELIYNEENKLQWVQLEVEGILHATADIRTKYARNTIECVVVSKITTAEQNPHIMDLGGLLKIGYRIEEKDIDVNIVKDRSTGYSYVYFLNQ